MPILEEDTIQENNPNQVKLQKKPIFTKPY